MSDRTCRTTHWLRIRHLWIRWVSDERGSLVSIELIIVATIVLIGSIAGLVSLRDAVNQELGDTAASLSRLNHTYYYNSIELDGKIDSVHYKMYIRGSSYEDQSNFCEPNSPDVAGEPPMGMQILAAGTVNEDAPVLPPEA